MYKEGTEHKSDRNRKAKVTDIDYDTVAPYFMLVLTGINVLNISVI